MGVAVGVARGGVACAITLTLSLTLGDVINNSKPNLAVAVTLTLSSGRGLRGGRGLICK